MAPTEHNRLGTSSVKRDRLGGAPRVRAAVATQLVWRIVLAPLLDRKPNSFLLWMLWT
jgi:hypothetical protein